MINFKQMAQDVIDGNESPYRAYGEITKLLAEVQAALDIVKDSAITESQKEDRTFYADGFYFERRNGNRTYDFKHIPEWIHADSFKKSVETKYKNYANASVDGLQMASADGEQILLPIVKYGRDVLMIKTKKDEVA